MKKNAHWYLSFLLMIIGGFYAFDLYQKLYEKKFPGTTSNVIDTDLHLDNVRLYVKEHSVERSLFHIDKAIHSIELTRDIVSDSLSQAELNQALADLEKVRTELVQGIVKPDHINHSFIIALNSLATAQLRLSEKYLKDGKIREAGHAIRYASNHIQNALKYADSSEMKEELEIYRKIDSLVHSKLDEDRIPDIESTVQKLETIE